MSKWLAGLCGVVLLVTGGQGARAEQYADYLIPGFLSLDISGVAFEYGCCAHPAQAYNGSIQWEWKQTRFDLFGDWYLGGYWEANVGYWHGDEGPVTSLWDFGLSPVFRLQPKSPVGLGISPHVEIATGVHYLTESSLNDLEFGMHFQFGSWVGAGIRFGDKQQFDLTYRYRHLSNAGIDQPNNGIEFHQFRFGYWFD